MTKLSPNIKHYFKAVPRGESVTPTRKETSHQNEIILLSSDEENEAETHPRNAESLELKPNKAMRKLILCSDDSDSETSTGVAHTRKSTENSPEKRPLNREEESFADSQEVQPKKKRRSTANRINDSDDENDEVDEGTVPDCSTENGTQRTECSQEQSQNTDEWHPGMQSSQYSSDSSGADDDDEELDTDEEIWINSYKEPDPWFLHKDSDKKKKPTKTKQGSASYDENQEVSIHKINLNHREFSRKSVERIIQFIVDKYNKGRDSSSSETKSRFKERHIHCEPVVKPEDEEHFSGDSFLVKVYVQKVARKISLLHSYGIREEATTIHSLIFHYRETELFAITTNQAWNVVQWCLDFDFPDIIAARILSKDGELQSTNKSLVGTELTRKTTHKQEKKTNPHDMLSLCTRYTAELRDNASILRLSCFQKNNASTVTENGDEEEGEKDDGEQEKENGTQLRKPSTTIKGAKVTVSNGNIRIHKRLSTSDILSILSILSEISNDKETYNLDNDIEQNSTAHKKYLTTVDNERAKELNLRLSKIIHDAIAYDNRMAELDNFQLCHKHTSDFFSGHSFKLLYKGDTIKEFSDTPTIKQIVVELRQELGEVSSGTSDRAFHQRLNDVKISYKYGHKEKKPEKLLNFIDGLLTDATDDSVCWHVMGKWCQFRDGYIYLVHNQFRKILNDYLLTDKTDPAYLRTPWTSNGHMSPEAKLENYLENFSNEGKTWISERPERDIVDMIRIGKDSDGRNGFFVYYFLPDLNTKTNVKCNRVAESIMQIGKANMQTKNQDADVAGSEDVKVQLNDVYQKLSQKRLFKSICPNFRQFLQMMAEAKFYLAIGRDATCIDVPSLENEKEMNKEISCRDIADIVENLIVDDRVMLNRTAASFNEQFDKCNGQRLAELIHRRLGEHEYIEKDSNSIREKLLSVGRNNFEVTANMRVNQFLYDKIICKFQPRACTVLSKLGFIDFSQEISKLTIKSFNLIEIPL